MKKLITCIVMLCTVAIFAQSKNYEISGKIVSENNQKPLEAATVYLERAKDSTLITYTITDKNGNFKLEGKSPYKDLRLNVSFIGYQSYAKLINYRNAPINLNTISLADANILDEVVLKSRSPITIKKDTVEFNVSSFKTKKDANVEDVLKELPGVEVDENGKITVNGKEVNKILVNGKPFFGNDPTITTRNLTKDIIEKIQITDTKSKAQAFSGEDSEGEDKTINLTIKKENNKGVFGRVSAGGGTDKRWEAAGMFNYFNNDRRISILAGGNNTNSPGFSFGEIQKMFGGSGNFRMNYSGGQMSFGVNGINFGGGQGITTSKNTGFNYADQIGKKVEISADYFYSTSDSEDQNATQRENFLPDSRYFTDSESTSSNHNDNHSANLDFEIEIDTTLLINIKPSFRYSTNKREFDREEESRDEANVVTNQSNTSSFSESKANNFSNDFDITKRFGSEGSFLRINLDNEFSTNDSDNFLNSETSIFGNNPSTISRNQFSENNENTNSFSSRLTYRLPLVGKKVYLDFRYTYGFENTDNEKSTYDFNNATQTFSDFNTELSTDFEYKNFRNVPGLRLTYNKDKFNINFGSDMVFRTLESEDFLRPQLNLKRNFSNLELNSRIRYRFSSKRSLYVRYRLDNQVPRLRQLQPFQDVSNPLNIITGNPALEPTNRHSLNFSFNNYDFQKGTGIYTYMGGDISNNDVVSNSTIDENFVRNTTYTNVNGNGSLYVGSGYSKTIKLDTIRTLKLNLGLGLNIRRSNNFNNGTKYLAKNNSISPNFGLTYTWKDVLEIRPNYRVSFNTNKFDLEQFDNREFVTHNLRISTRTSVPKNLEWENQISFNYNSNIADGFQKSAWFWNSTLSYSIMKNKGMITLKAYDLLNQNTNARRISNENYIQDSQSTVLQQYFMLGFSYKFNTLGKAGEVRKDRFRMF